MAAQEIETRGARTFSAKEMAFNILGLVHPILFSITQVKLAWGDCIHVHRQRAELRRAIAR
ncbi:hypothetical protein BC827DRAFT_1182898, partial [Russula dissimulans]